MLEKNKMFKGESLISLLQNFNSQLIIGQSQSAYWRDLTRKWYSNLTDEEFENTRYKYILCGQIADLFFDLLKENQYNPKKIFINHISIPNMVDLVFDGSYIRALMNKEFDFCCNQEKQIDLGTESTSYGTHAVIGIGDIIVDPTLGIVYPFGIESLMKADYQILYETLIFSKQYEYLLTSRHRNMVVGLTYFTPTFWNNIVDASIVRG
jgi:hypothetical protein